MSFSSLYISGKYASNTQHKIFQAIKPIIDFRSLLHPAALTAMRQNISRRSGCRYLSVTTSDLDNMQPFEDLASLSLSITRLRMRRGELREQLKADKDDTRSSIIELTTQINELKEQFYELEDRVMPTILNLPASLGDGVPDEDIIEREANIDLIDRVRSFKQLDYRQLSYINESVFASLVGPESLYDIGRFARLRYSIIEMFAQQIRDNGFHDFSGLDFTKSPVVEAVRSKLDRDYDADPFSIDRGYEDASDTVKLHLSGESSLESFCAYASRMGRKMRGNTRLFAFGTEYGKTENGLVQSQTVRTFSLLTMDEKTEDEVKRLTDAVWNLYPSLSVPVRGVRVSAANLMPNESCRFDVLVYHPIRKEWKRVAYVANYTDFVPQRLGIEDRQLVSSVAVDSRILAQAIVEINQTENGSFIVPKGLDIFGESDPPLNQSQ